MKIDQVTMDYIKRVVKCATLAKINNVAIEPDKIRGMDDDQVVFMFHTKNIPFMDVGSVGLNRLNTFTSRLDLATGVSGVEIDALTEDDKNGQRFVRGISMKGKGIKIDYRCANPAVIRAPKRLQDTLKYQINMTPDVLFFMTKGQQAMGSDEVKIVCKDSSVSFEISDINGDAMTYEFPAEAVMLDGSDDTSFSHTYPLKTILPLFKACPDEPFCITTPTGMLKLQVDGFDVYIMPRS